MTDRVTLRLNDARLRRRAHEAIDAAPDGWFVVISPPARSLEQNAKLHAILQDLARSDLSWAGRRRSLPEWKVIAVSGHAVATRQEAEIVAGIEGELVNLRESTADMGVRRTASLIEYLTAFCAERGVRLSAPEWMEPDR